jgi:hypothetical protein
MLRLEMGDLKSLGFDLALTGFDDVELGALFADKNAGLTDPDATPPVPEHPVSALGDLWLLGPHRLLCGDSTVATDVERVLGGVEPHLMVTDPPYGVSYDPKWRDELGIDWTGQAQRRSTHPGARPISSRSLGKVPNDDRADWSETWALFPGHIAYVWHGGLHAGVVEASLVSAGCAGRTFDQIAAERQPQAASEEVDAA